MNTLRALVSNQQKDDMSCIGFYEETVNCANLNGNGRRNRGSNSKPVYRTVCVSFVETEMGEMENEEGLQSVLLVVSLNDIIMRYKENKRDETSAQSRLDKGGISATAEDFQDFLFRTVTADYLSSLDSSIPITALYTHEMYSDTHINVQSTFSEVTGSEDCDDMISSVVRRIQSEYANMRSFLFDASLPSVMAGGYVSLAHTLKRDSRRGALLRQCSSALAALVVCISTSVPPVPLLTRVSAFEWLKEELSECIWANDLLTSIISNPDDIERQKYLACVDRMSTSIDSCVERVTESLTYSTSGPAKIFPARDFAVTTTDGQEVCLLFAIFLARFSLIVFFIFLSFSLFIYLFISSLLIQAPIILYSFPSFTLLGRLWVPI